MARVLTTEVLEVLTDFYVRYGLKFDIVLRENNIFIRFWTGKMFEPKLFTNPLSEKNIYRYYAVVKFIIEVNHSIEKAVKAIEI